MVYKMGWKLISGRSLPVQDLIEYPSSPGILDFHFDNLAITNQAHLCTTLAFFAIYYNSSATYI